MDGLAKHGGISSLVILARLHGIAVDPGAIRHWLGLAPEAIGADDLVRAARWLHLRSRAIRTCWARLSQSPLPAMARWNDEYLVLARVGDDAVLVQQPTAHEPRALSRAEFEAGWDGSLILVARRAMAGGPDSAFGFGWFVPALLKYRGLLGEVLLASFVLQLFALVTPLFFQVVIDKVLVHRGLSTLDVLAIGLLLVSLFEVLLTALRGYILSHTSNRVDVQLGARLFGQLLHLPLTYFESRRVGDTVARVRELESIRQFLTGSSLTLVLDLAFTLVFFVVLSCYSLRLTFIVAATLPGYVLLAALVTPVLRARLNEKFNRGADSQAFLVETVSGVETVKAAAVEPQAQRRWEDLLAAYVGASFRATNLLNIAQQAASFLNKLTVVLILWIGARQVIEGHLSVGQLIAFNMLAARISGPILRLAQLWQDFQQASISVRRLADILDVPAEPAYRPSRGSLSAIRGAIRIENLTFRYRPGTTEVLRDLSLDLAPGEVLGVVGPSGSGKSTLAKLVQRLYVPEAGRVLVDGVDLRLVDTAWLRRQIGGVLQENRLFRRSVRDNIALADPSLPIERVIQAAELAGAHEFILQLPEGYDTVLEEHAANLSGGQRQRIAIARALVTDPRILIFDEATSALDYESEYLIQRNMRAICRNRTVLIIAHRLASVRFADRIVVLDRGAIVEQGGHGELRDRNGYYARLYRLQTEMLGEVQR
jgi:subfamily B ATP-binding cassette protein HlyB/CyaB